MALDPRISLAVQAPNVTPAINLFNQAMQQKRANDLMPGQLDLQQQQIQARQQANQAGALNLENAQDAADLKSIAQFGAMNEDLLVAAENGDSLPLQKALAARARDLMSSNRSPSQTLEALQLIQSGDVKTAVSGFRNAGKVAKQQGLLGGNSSTGTIERDRLLNDVNSSDPVVRQSALVKLGVAPRAVGSANQTIAQTGNVGQVANVVSELSGASEKGKLKEKIKLEPELQAKINDAKSIVKLTADDLVKNKSNESALRVYNVGIQNLESALGATSTGKLSGLLPAMTSNAQAAEGAIAVMAPILKQMFRSAGEGNFTDSDQKLLMDMVPNRSDSPEAIKLKLKFIDDTVQAKLSPVNTVGQENTLTTNPEAQMEQPTNSGFKILSIE